MFNSITSSYKELGGYRTEEKAFIQQKKERRVNYQLKNNLCDDYHKKIQLMLNESIVKRRVCDSGLFEKEGSIERRRKKKSSKSSIHPKKQKLTKNVNIVPTEIILVNCKNSSILPPRPVFESKIQRVEQIIRQEFDQLNSSLSALDSRVMNIQNKMSKI